MAIGTAYLRINGKKTRAYRELFGQFFSKGGCLLRAKGTDAFATPGTPFFMFPMHCRGGYSKTGGVNAQKGLNM